MVEMERLHIPEEFRQSMIDHVSAVLPEEGCGVLIGKNNLVEKNLPITNQAHSQNRYFMEPVELVHAFEQMDSLNLDLLAIYHSHPNGPQIPSETDIKEFFYPGVVTLILTPHETRWTIRAFEIKNNTFFEIGFQT